ncbi:PREDICTED: uncharacterized protein LOC108773526 [Cyphomyrmex costatus]|uniref:uncharacterized protein LOC108773526 n=1 Tax=Cyphomyrmex costatus TaxID=456900 RepID=UPI0008523B29|nr:PREDICTED: uncharacterized protein LOC108773526 [Cyphomyrmex costatus]
MAKNVTVKKTRSSRTTPLQYTKMLDFFYLNKGLAEGKFNSLHRKEETQRKWTKLAAELNNVQGATKTAEQWQVDMSVMYYELLKSNETITSECYRQQLERLNDNLMQK